MLSSEQHDVFEQMHYVCFHYEFEHDPIDPDEECEAGGCPSGAIHPRPERRPDNGISNRPEPGFVTIVRSRYGGAYEPGKWIAFPMEADALPAEWAADDVTCMRLFEERKGDFGGGASPQEAYEDLLRILRSRA